MKSKTFHRLIFAEINFSKISKILVYTSPSNSIIFSKNLQFRTLNFNNMFIWNFKYFIRPHEFFIWHEILSQF